MPSATDAVCLVTAITPNETTVFTAGTIKRIHVNQHVIRRNKKTGACEPAITIQWKNKSYRFHDIAIEGPSSVIYSPEKPLSCGAHIWVETTATVVAKTELRKHSAQN